MPESLDVICWSAYLFSYNDMSTPLYVDAYFFFGSELWPNAVI